MVRSHWLLLGLTLWLGLQMGCAVTTSSKSTDQPPGQDKSRSDAAAKAVKNRSPEPDPDAVTSAFAHYATAISMEINGDEEGALEQFSAAARAVPSEEGIVLEVVRRRIQRKETEEALEALESSIRSGKATARVYASHGYVLDQLKRPAEAKRSYERAVSMDPGMLMGYQGLLTHHLRAGHFGPSLKLVRQAASQPSSDPAYWIEVAEMHISLLQLHPKHASQVRPATLDALAKVQSFKPTNPALLQRLAEQYKAIGEYATAARVLEDTLELVPSPVLREKLVDVHLRQGRRDLALEQLDALRKEFPANAQIFFVMGSIQAELKKYPEAIDLIQTAIKLKPDFEQAYYDLAGAHFSSGLTNEAFGILDQARTRFQPSFLLEFYTAITHSRAKNYAQAIPHLEAAEKIAQGGETNRLNAIFYFQLGATLERSGNHPRAEAAFRQCLSLDPDFAEALNYLGYMWADRNENLREARKLIERAVELEPDNAAFLDSLGWVLFRLGRPKAALPWLQKSIAKSEEMDATLFDHLGDVLAALGRFAEAQDAWRQSLKVEANPAVQKKLDESLATHPPS